MQTGEALAFPFSTAKPFTMKVLLINTSDHTGGAAIAALRLLKALRKAGVDATLLCRDRSLPAERTDVVNLKPTLWRKVKFALERFDIFCRNGFSREGLFAVDTARFGNDITKLPEFREADVVHLHWTNQAMLSLDNLQRILKSGKRVVWTMHDMWPFTGVCHNAADCERWKQGCGLCPQLKKPQHKDLSACVFNRKLSTYAHGRFTLVGCSQWLAGLAAQAPLLKEQQVVSIPNPIDTDFYAPVGTEEMPTDKVELRKQLNLPADKRLLLFTAFKVTDPKKGIDYLIESICMLCNERPELRNKLAIVLAGKEADKLTGAFPVEAVSMGYVESEEQMRQLYQAADLLLMPTLMDNLPNTIVEAMACGVPCVAFGVGGVPQMIDTGVNGFLAEPKNALDFAQCIQRALDSHSYTALCRNARIKALTAYSEKTVAESYLEIYQNK